MGVEIKIQETAFLLSLVAGCILPTFPSKNLPLMKPDKDPSRYQDKVSTEAKEFWVRLRVTTSIGLHPLA